MAKIRFLTAGESHGPKLSAIIEGLPAGFLISPKLIDDDLARRQQGFGRGGRMKIEKDQVKISAGVVDAHTTGAPIAIEITNLDYKNWQDKEISPMSSPRPGHADFAGAIKYGHDDLRISLERASARETAMRTAVGSLLKQILGNFNIKVMGYVTKIGPIESALNHVLHSSEYEERYQRSLKNEFAFIDEEKTAEIRLEIMATMKAKDTLGGVFEVVGIGIPPGLGSYVHYDRKLDGLIAQAMMSIPAMKAVEIGDGITNSALRGTLVHDEFKLNKDKIERLSNRAGGLEGGVSNGMPIVCRVYMKPISTTLTPLRSVDLAKKEEGPTIYERSDFCAVQRAAVIGEAMLSHVLLDALIDKIGGDNKSDMMKAFERMAKGNIHDFTMKTAAWQFNYEK